MAHCCALEDSETSSVCYSGIRIPAIHAVD